MKKIFIILLFFIGSASFCFNLAGQNLMTNIPGRKTSSLNGQWQVIIDQYNHGDRGFWNESVATGKADFYEYSFAGNLVLNVPGDWNSQVPELKYYEGTIWYKKSFQYKKTDGKRVFVYFGAVNYKAEVFLNGRKLGSHEGGFTAFQFEVTDFILEGNNSLIVRVNNERIADGIPSLKFDWWNYGGITREIFLVETPKSFIGDYFIQLQKGSLNQVKGWVQMNGNHLSQEVKIEIPEAKIKVSARTNDSGLADIQFSANLILWSPENPKLYEVLICSETDTIREKIGFRSIEVKGTEILLNKKSIFLKGITFHEEIPQRAGRAYSQSDAIQLLTWAKELGCNFIRLAHYPQNENTVRMAEQMGFMMWEEIPVWQGIDFNNPVIMSKTNTMLKEMIIRDKNRCGIIIWSMSNETAPSVKRNQTITSMARLSREMDPTRLITSAFDHIQYEKNTVTIDDSLSLELDVLAVNEYIGWYRAWPCAPNKVVWKSNFDKPLIMSEFGAEALYGNGGSGDIASSWTEDYQKNLYINQIEMFKNISFLKGTCPWVLADFRSPFRMHPVFQHGWNRKGLISDNGYKKKAWFVMKQYYDSIK